MRSVHDESRVLAWPCTDTRAHAYTSTRVHMFNGMQDTAIMGADARLG